MSLYGPSTVIPVYSVLAGVGLIVTGVRFWVRTTYARAPLGLDDLFMVLGVIVVSACTAMQYYNAIHGTGGEAVTDPNTREKAIVASRQMDWSMIVIEKSAFGFVKLSILFFYRRIFGVWPSFRRINSVLIGIIIAWTVAFTVADVLLCGAHPELIWGYDQTIARSRCGNRGLLLLCFSVTSTATDLTLLMLPFFYLSRLRMPRQKKIATSFVFFLAAMYVTHRKGATDCN